MLLVRWLMPLILLFLIVHSTDANSGENKVAEKTLRQVHLLYRHGARAPIRGYRKDPNNSEDLWANGWGELTQDGLRMQQKLGKWLRRRFNKLLSRRWNSTELYVYSTDVDRTLNSAQANLQGLYFRQDNSGRYDPDLNWSPIPVHTAPSGSDVLLNIDESCPRVKIETAKMHLLPEVVAKTNSCQPLFHLLTEKLGEAVDTLVAVDFVHDYFTIQKENHIKIPEWVLQHMAFMKEISAFTFRMLAMTPELKRLRGGPLLSKILGDMEQMSNGSSATPTLFMYSAHDTTVAINLETLGLFNNQPPPYASTVIYELHHTDAGYHVNMFFRNDTNIEEEPHAFTLHNCTFNCPLPEFARLLHPVLPVDFAAECRVDGNDSEAIVIAVHRAVTLYQRVSLGLSGCILVVLVLLVAVMCRHRRFVHTPYTQLQQEE